MVTFYQYKTKLNHISGHFDGIKCSMLFLGGDSMFVCYVDVSSMRSARYAIVLYLRGLRRTFYYLMLERNLCPSMGGLFNYSVLY